MEVTLANILRACDAEDFVVTAYCFMPDHVHALAEGSSDRACLKTFVSRAKQLSGFHFKREFGRRLWQAYGYERVLREEEGTPEIIRYIVHNPVRAGLVQSPTDYPFWGSQVVGREELLEYAQRAG